MRTAYACSTIQIAKNLQTVRCPQASSAHTRRLSRCREEAGVQHNRREAHHRQDERPTPGGKTGAERRRAAHAATCSAPLGRRGSGSKDPKATSRGHGGGSITRSGRHPPARSPPTRRQARRLKQWTRTAYASAAVCTEPPDRIRSVPEQPAATGVHEPVASAPCDRAKPGRKSATRFSELRPRSAYAPTRLRACPGAPRVWRQGCPPRSRDPCGRPITLAPTTSARVFVTEYPSGAKIMPPDCTL